MGRCADHAAAKAAAFATSNKRQPRRVISRTGARAVMAVLLSTMLLITGVTPAFAGEIALPSENTGAAYAEGVSDTSGAAVTGGSETAGRDAPKQIDPNASGAFSNETAADPAGSTNGIAADPIGSMGDGSSFEEPAVEGDAATGNDILAEPAWTPDDGLPNVTGVTLNIINDTQLVVSWKTAQVFDGYEISYAKNILYLRDKTITVDDPEANNVTIDGLDTTKRYYVRVRGYKEYLGDQLWSDWTSKKTSKSNATASVKFVKANGKKVDVRKQAGSKLNGYTVSQGTCSDGRFLYMCFECRNGDENGSGRARIKIAKVRVSDWKVVKVSGSLKLGHANDITYNGNRRILVVTGAKTNDPYVRIVDPSSLKKTGKKKIKLDSSYSYVKAYNAIDYDPESHTYYIRSRSYGGLCFTLGEDFRMIDYSVVPSDTSRYVQSCATLGDHFILTQSKEQSSSKNSITIFEKAGKKLQEIKIKLTGELESIFMIGNELYATVHKHVGKSYKTGYILRILL